MNLVVALDALLTENSVTAAAERLHTSAPTMSRTLARLRRILDDPLLVRAGRDLVPTPRALELRNEVRAVTERAKALFAPAPAADPTSIVRTFDLQITDMFATTVMAQLITDVRTQAPGITLRFRPGTLEDTPALREGLVDLEVGVLGHADPEIRSETPDHRVARRCGAGNASPCVRPYRDRAPVRRGRPRHGVTPRSPARPDRRGARRSRPEQARLFRRTTYAATPSGAAEAATALIGILQQEATNM